MGSSKVTQESIATDDAFDLMVDNLRILFDGKADLDSYNDLFEQVQELAAMTRKVVREDVFSPLTDQQLNLQYPDAVSGMQVICPFITGGGELYEKFNDTSDAWFRLYMSKGTGVSSPGVMLSLEIGNFV
ncbi:hypothetical protein SAMN05428988_0465 [Chitinophaga sp. YR573]|uniref:hypothetical protein n=1 Tax=Chitinophaga sp. YR573 TaxID=1881040 RepID=UPI0008B2E2F1|nr:hypothetical protein [Chitinophaga sp. YR573]SEV92152.1 hypothetical protein SAMN05428988_0465 [Chitinophaga sp. YR573]